MGDALLALFLSGIDCWREEGVEGLELDVASVDPVSNFLATSTYTQNVYYLTYFIYYISYVNTLYTSHRLYHYKLHTKLYIYTNLRIGHDSSIHQQAIGQLPRQ